MFYVVGTAIGNIEDTSLRTVKTLANSDVILTEDTATFDSYYRRVQELFKLIPKKSQRCIHFHKENEFEKTPEIINLLDQNLTVSLVSESGLPAIADPGSDLIIRIIKSGLPFSVIPGPTAFTTAAVLSGFPTNQIMFLGFLPKKESAIVKIFTQLVACRSKEINPTIVFYESPHRINKTLQALSNIIPNAQIAIAREITKKFEEIIRGEPSELLSKKYKGELTVAVRI